MDIYKHKDTLLKWIWSCQTAPQLDLFTRLVTEFEGTRIVDKDIILEIELVKKELFDAIIEQRITIAGNSQPMRVTGNCLIVPNESILVLSNN